MFFQGKIVQSLSKNCHNCRFLRSKFGFIVFSGQNFAVFRYKLSQVWFFRSKLLSKFGYLVV